MKMSDIYQSVEERKLQLSEYIRQLRLLFKPWPLKGTEETTEEENSTKQEVKKDTNSTDKSQDAETLSVAEQAEVEMVDRLLHRAKKALDVQKRIDEPKKVKTKSSLKEQDERSVVEQQQQHHQHSDDLKRDTKHITSSSQIDRNVSKQLSTRTGNVKENEVTSARKSESARIKSSSSSTKPIQRPPGRVKSTASNVSVPGRTGIVERRSVPAKGRAAPVHLSAPFQTNPRLATAKLQTTYSASTSARSRGRGSSALGRGGHSHRNFNQNAVNVIKTDSERGDNPVNENVTQQKSVSPLLDLSDFKEDYYDKFARTKNDLVEKIPPPSMKASEPNTVAENRNTNAKLQTNFLSKVQNDKSKDLRKDQVEDTKETVPLFELIRDGSKLSVPPKLMRYFSNNTRLKQKLFMKKVTTKVDSPAASRNIPVQLNHEFGSECDVIAQSVARNVQHVVKSFTKLNHILQGLGLRYFNKESSAVDVFHAKKILEFILVSFEETTTLLHSLDISQLQDVTLSDSRRVEVAPPDVQSVSVWYNKGGCFSDWIPAPVVKYHTVRELEKYMQLRHQAQLLQLHMDTLDTVNAELFPLLQSLDPSSSEFIQVLRCGYQLLTLSSRVTPVVVKDTMDEVDDSVIEDT